MTELTDLEITKRIATIAYPQAKIAYEGLPSEYLYIDHVDEEFNPLQNGNIICDLIEKYKPWIKTDHYGQIWAEIYDDDGYSKGVGVDKNLKRAVCLCLIEAFNEDLK